MASIKSPEICCAVNSKPTKILVDSGSVITLIRRGYLPALNRSLSGIRVRPLCGPAAELWGPSPLKFKFGPYEYEWEVYEADMAEDCLLGSDFMGHFDVNILYSNKTIQICRRPDKMPLCNKGIIRLPFTISTHAASLAPVSYFYVVRAAATTDVPAGQTLQITAAFRADDEYPDDPSVTILDETVCRRTQWCAPSGAGVTAAAPTVGVSRPITLIRERTQVFGERPHAKKRAWGSSTLQRSPLNLASERAGLQAKQITVTSPHRSACSLGSPAGSVTCQGDGLVGGPDLTRSGSTDVTVVVVEKSCAQAQLFLPPPLGRVAGVAGRAADLVSIQRPPLDRLVGVPGRAAEDCSVSPPPLATAGVAGGSEQCEGVASQARNGHDLDHNRALEDSRKLLDKLTPLRQGLITPAENSALPEEVELSWGVVPCVKAPIALELTNTANTRSVIRKHAVIAEVHILCPSIYSLPSPPLPLPLLPSPYSS